MRSASRRVMRPRIDMDIRCTTSCFLGRLERCGEVVLDSNSAKDAPVPMDVVIALSGKGKSIYPFPSLEGRNECSHKGIDYSHVLSSTARCQQITTAFPLKVETATATRSSSSATPPLVLQTRNRSPDANTRTRLLPQLTLHIHLDQPNCSPVHGLPRSHRDSWCMTPGRHSR
jgi:hypothetical protein